MKQSKRLLAALLAVSLSGSLSAGWFSMPTPENKKAYAAEDMKDRPKIERELGAEAGIKKPFVIQRGDTTLTLDGKFNNEYFFYKNAVMLNSNIPDEYGYFRSTMDSGLNVAYGEKKYGHKAFELGAKTRFKTIWGMIGYTGSTEKSSVALADSIVGSHSHKSNKSLLWVKEAWVSASLNAIMGRTCDKQQFLKAGMFSFKLGRGIALGGCYGYIKDFLAMYNRATDYSPFGLLLTGELIKNKLSYDLYFGKFEEKSAKLGDTFNHVKENHMGRKAAWAGAAKDSDVVAARLKITPIENTAQYGVLEIEPYAMYNEASDQKVELLADSKSSLGTAGLNLEYQKKNFEIGGEVAFNFGEEKLYAVDRNQIKVVNTKFKGDANEALREVYSHVFYAEDDDLNTAGKQVIYNSTNRDIVKNSCNTCNGTKKYNDNCVLQWDKKELLGNTAATGSGLMNASNRFRPAYKNKYRGWMAVIDAAYHIEKANLKAAVSYGYASGDKNPHVEEKNKNYDGFVGLNECYSGKRVPSLFILDARKVKRPLTLKAGSVSSISTDDTFSDLHFVGLGFTWKPEVFKNKKFVMTPNMLFFWKAHTSPAYCKPEATGCTIQCNGKTVTLKEGVATNKNAGKFLGTEFNVSESIEVLKDLTVTSDFAVFVPGTYYDDIQGAPMAGVDFQKLEEADLQGIPSAQYRLANDPAFFIRVGAEYKF